MTGTVITSINMSVGNEISSKINLGAELNNIFENEQFMFSNILHIMNMRNTRASMPSGKRG